MRKILTGTLLVAISLNSLSWAEPPKPPAEAEKTKATPQVQAAQGQTSTLPTPLPAEMFQGRAREAYKAAAEIPDVFAQISCYCGCAKSHGHRNLLDCFVDDHGAG